MHVQHSMAQWCTYCLLSDSLQVVSPVFSRLLFDFFSISCFLPSRLLFSASAPSLSSSHLISPQFTSFLLITSIIRFSTVKHSTVILCSFWIFTFPHNDISPSLLFIVLYCSLLFCFVFFLFSLGVIHTLLRFCLSVSLCAPLHCLFSSSSIPPLTWL